MSTKIRSKKLVAKPTPEVAELLQTLFNRVRAADAAKRVWSQLLSVRDRKLLGDDLSAAWTARGTIGMWMRVKHVTWGRALIDLAALLGWLNEARRDWLLRESGEATEVARPGPSWDAETGELTMDGQVVRRVAARAKNLRCVLAVFEEEGWPPRIDDPLPGGANAKRLHRAIETLNDGIAQISFHSDGNGEGITWRHASTG